MAITNMLGSEGETGTLVRTNVLGLKTTLGYQYGTASSDILVVGRKI